MATKVLCGAANREMHSFERVIWGHHKFKSIWFPSVGETLAMKHEKGNRHDRSAVAMIQWQSQPAVTTIVGLIPTKFQRYSGSSRIVSRIPACPLCSDCRTVGGKLWYTHDHRMHRRVCADFVVEEVFFWPLRTLPVGCSHVLGNKYWGTTLVVVETKECLAGSWA